MIARDLSSYRYRARVLVVVADDRADPRFERQRAWLAGSQVGRRERRLEVVTIVGDGAAVRRALGIPPGAGFRVLLLGLDGGVKLVRRTPLSIAEVFAAIDAMPMRREELRRSR